MSLLPQQTTPTSKGDLTWVSSVKRFGALAVLPKVLGLCILRVFASQLAGVSVTLATIVALDRAARDAVPNSPSSFRRAALTAAAATVIVHVPACVFLFVGALESWHLCFGMDTGSFVILVLEVLGRDDPLFGFGRTAMYGLILIGLLFGGRRVWMSTKSPLTIKLAAGGAALVILPLVEWSIGFAVR